MSDKITYSDTRSEQDWNDVLRKVIEKRLQQRWSELMHDWKVFKGQLLLGSIFATCLLLSQGWLGVCLLPFLAGASTGYFLYTRSLVFFRDSGRCYNFIFKFLQHPDHVSSLCRSLVEWSAEDLHFLTTPCGNTRDELYTRAIAYARILLDEKEKVLTRFSRTRSPSGKTIL